MWRDAGGEPYMKSGGEASGGLKGEPSGEFNGEAAWRTTLRNSSRVRLLGAEVMSTWLSQVTKSRTASSSRWSGGVKRNSRVKSSFRREGAIISSSLRHGSPGIGT